MAHFEAQQVFFSDQGLPTIQQDKTSLYSEASKRFQNFIRQWQHENIFTYRQQIEDNVANGNFYLKVQLDDINNFDNITSSQLKTQPFEFLPVFEESVKELYARQKDLPKDDVPNFQLQIVSEQNPIPLRQLSSTDLNKLITVQGIIINASRPEIKGKILFIECRGCHHTQQLIVPPGIAQVSLPRFCQATNTNQVAGSKKCPPDSYVVIPEKCSTIDQQTLKIQEAPEMVPTGEIPRTFQVCVDRYLTNKLIPGTRCKITGVYKVVEKSQISTKSTKSLSQSLKIPYIYSVGFITDRESQRKYGQIYSAEDEEKFQAFAKDKQILNKVSSNIASAIFGHDDIKKAIACLLFGGSRKILPDKTQLRGDINILLIGDPSTAKSQFLKFVERIAPISVYTSGKGSSAAGLTASVIRDSSTGEFQLEGGAMVLADGGVVCIDEFDKMKPNDRVAIHEAMEQQTISVAKAGITTILNTRTSVLAAANPVFGSYDDFKLISDQIQLQTTILSRFDCIFIVRDIRSEEYDKTLAQHIIDLHMGQIQIQNEGAQFDLEFFKKYISYAKAKCSPRLTEVIIIINKVMQVASQALQNLYVEDRKKVQEAKNARKQHIPISVRQLEAIIRLSEAIAKIRLSNQVTIDDIDEAHRLFRVSTLNAISEGLEVGIEVPENLSTLIIKIEDSIKRRVPIGSKINSATLAEELINRFNSAKAVQMAVYNLIQNDEFQQIQGKKVLQRIR